MVVGVSYRAVILDSFAIDTALLKELYSGKYNLLKTMKSLPMKIKLAPATHYSWGTALVLALLFGFVAQIWAQTTRPIVIAHRGASGYLPEHTLAAKVLAY